MRILVVGLGSMGRRRIRLLKNINECSCIVGVDFSNERLRQSENMFGIITYNDIEAALKSEQLDCAFICTAPSSHNKLIAKCLGENLHIFTELNLISDGYKENLELACKHNKVLFLSSTFLYRKEILFIENQVKSQRQKFNYNYHVGQYLPDWHPWERYQDFFIGNAQTNGCREIFAVELPWLVQVFGAITNIQVVKSNITTLDIHFPDNYIVILEHQSGNKGSFHVNVVSKKAVRNLEIYGENLYIEWNGSPDGLFQYDCIKQENRAVSLYDAIDKLDKYSTTIIENAYSDEIHNFFEVIGMREVPKYTFEQDKEILELIDMIERD